MKKLYMCTAMLLVILAGCQESEMPEDKEVNSAVPESMDASIVIKGKLEPGKEVIIQKSAFLASEENVETSVFFNKKFSSGIFGGEGFIMQKLSGDGLAFLEIDGSVMEYELAIGESMLINTGYLAAMSESCKLKVETVAGLKNKFFGGEGFFNTAVSGPGHVWIQTMPANKMAGALRPYIPNGD